MDANSALKHKVELLSRKIESLTMGQNKALAITDSELVSPLESDQVEQVEFMGNQVRPRNDPFSNTYNPGRRNHPIFRWSNNQGQVSNM